MIKKLLFLCVSIFLFTTSVLGQDDYPYPPLSAYGKITQMVGFTKITIEYERPSVRKRKVFGGLVPWNKIWRTGAGKCTKISFDRPVIIEDQNIDAGTYSIFTIPNPDEWIVILNKDTSLYGSGFYDSAKDVVRFIVIPQLSNRFYETLNFDIELIPNNANIYLSWANTQIRFTLETSTDQEIEKMILEELLTGKQTKADLYAGAAEYRYLQGSDQLQALALCKMALELDPDNGWARGLNIKLYIRLKMYTKALEGIELEILKLKKANFKNEKDRQREIQYWLNEANTLKEEID